MNVLQLPAVTLHFAVGYHRPF